MPDKRLISGLAILATFLVILMAVVGSGAGKPAYTDVKPEHFDNYIKVEDLYTGRRTVGEDVGLPVVWFRLRNVGDAAVSDVTVRVTFLDSMGRTVHEQEFHPVHSGYDPDGSAKPLAPGEVWQMSFIQFYMPEGVPMTWKTGNARAEVAELSLVTR
ncbi:MAG: hypothetical protein EP335_03865 [Alphaproteobacteria bacterium]|nr:MAG: hypothetical protein EP335_03865 [Alphaproteobacteria bacterium]